MTQTARKVGFRNILKSKLHWPKWSCDIRIEVEVAKLKSIYFCPLSPTIIRAMKQQHQLQQQQRPNIRCPFCHRFYLQLAFFICDLCYTYSFSSMLYHLLTLCSMPSPHFFPKKTASLCPSSAPLIKLPKKHIYPPDIDKAPHYPLLAECSSLCATYYLTTNESRVDYSHTIPSNERTLSTKTQLALLWWDPMSVIVQDPGKSHSVCDTPRHSFKNSVSFKHNFLVKFFYKKWV